MLLRTIYATCIEGAQTHCTSLESDVKGIKHLVIPVFATIFAVISMFAFISSLRIKQWQAPNFRKLAHTLGSLTLVHAMTYGAMRFGIGSAFVLTHIDDQGVLHLREIFWLRSVMLLLTFPLMLRALAIHISLSSEKAMRAMALGVMMVIWLVSGDIISPWWLFSIPYALGYISFISLFSSLYRWAIQSTNSSELPPLLPSPPQATNDQRPNQKVTMLKMIAFHAILYLPSLTFGDRFASFPLAHTWMFSFVPDFNITIVVLLMVGCHERNRLDSAEDIIPTPVASESTPALQEMDLTQQIQKK